MKNVSDLAKNQEDAAKKAEDEKRLKAEERNKKIVPTIALVIANIIFISLDFRAYDVVKTLTGKTVLAAVTVIVAGVMALLWWDLFYPHSRKHDNIDQRNISILGAAVGVILSLVLAFLDYLVASTINTSLLWGIVILSTGIQGILLAWWWHIDASIDASAKRNQRVASRVDLQDTAKDFEAEIENLSSLSDKLEHIKKQFPGKGQAAKAARSLGYPVLAEMLSDDDGDGVPNYMDSTDNRRPAPRPQAQPSYAQTVERAEEKGGNGNRPSSGQR